MRLSNTPECQLLPCLFVRTPCNRYSLGPIGVTHYSLGPIGVTHYSLGPIGVTHLQIEGELRFKILRSASARNSFFGLPVGHFSLPEFFRDFFVEFILVSLIHSSPRSNTIQVL